MEKLYFCLPAEGGFDLPHFTARHALDITRLFIFTNFFIVIIDFSIDIWYNIHATQTAYFLSDTENTLVKSVFSYSHTVSERVCVATIEGKHFFGAYGFGCAHFFILECFYDHHVLRTLPIHGIGRRRTKNLISFIRDHRRPSRRAVFGRLRFF